MTKPRSTTEVLENHIQLRNRGALDDDLEHNYAPDVIFLCQHGAYRGREMVRRSGLDLLEQLGGEANYEFVAQQIDEEYALLLWRAQSPKARINAGVDTFVIRAGLIVMQSVFYELEPEETRTHKPRK
jgi:hypothetical protein